MLHLNSDQTVAMIAGTSFAAGLNVYATVGVLGLLSRTGVIELPSGLHLVTSWWIIGVCLAMFVLEFFADKVPMFDLLWNALHTFVRIPIAAYVAYAATSHLSPQMQLASTLMGAAIAFAAHGGKTALRAAVTPSPEPFSNMALSFGEDVGAISLTWVATQHPYVAAAVVAVLLVLIIVCVRWVVRSLRNLYHNAAAAIASA
ncbi:MAG: DUF4126 domain-containing protein [Candidatus Korobacteraceae bacterium]